MNKYNFIFDTSVQLLSRVWLSATLWVGAHQVSLSTTNSWSLLKLMSIEWMMPSNHLVLFHPFFSCLQSFPASGSFLVSHLFASDGQSIGTSASTSVLPMNIQDWSPLGLTGLVSLQSKGLSRVFSNTTVQSINSSSLSFPCSPTLTSIHDHWKTHSFDHTDLYQKVMSLFFNMLSKFVIAFFPWSKSLLISRL